MAKKKKNSNYKYSAPELFPTEKKEEKTPRAPLSMGAKIAIVAACVALVLAIIIGCVVVSILNKSYVEMDVEGYGKIVICVDRGYAPKTVENFLALVEDGYYDGTTFHRVMKNFMIQGGSSDKEDELDSIVGEFSSNGFNNTLSHTRGVISMARTNEPNSAASQFFICNADSPHLDGQYAAFGYVVKGIEVVDAITEATAGYAISNGFIDDTSKMAVIKSVRIVDAP